MREKFESYMKELIEQSKTLMKYGVYLTVFFILVLILLLIFKIQNKNSAFVVFDLLLILVFLFETFYGMYMYNKFNWVLNHYQDDRSKCLELLTVRNKKYNRIQVDKEKENIPFGVKFYSNINLAYKLLKEEDQ